jgi:hypothetical protein
VSNYNDDHDRFYQELDELGGLRQAAAREQRLRELASRMGTTRSTMLKRREALIVTAMKIFQMPRADAEAWTDKHIGLDPSH